MVEGEDTTWLIAPLMLQLLFGHLSPNHFSTFHFSVLLPIDYLLVVPINKQVITNFQLLLS